MEVIGAAEIPGILGTLGWNPRTLDDKTWRCTVPTPTGTTRIVVRYAGAWLYLTVIPFLDAASITPFGTGKYPVGFLGRILAVNHNLVLVKFALDDDGDLVLRVELPTESLQRREVETAAQMLLRTTDQYRAPIREALLDATRRSEAPGPNAPSVAPPGLVPSTAPEALPSTPPGALADPPLDGPELSTSDPSPDDAH